MDTICPQKQAQELNKAEKKGNTNEWQDWDRKMSCGNEKLFFLH